MIVQIIIFQAIISFLHGCGLEDACGVGTPSISKKT